MKSFFLFLFLTSKIVFATEAFSLEQSLQSVFHSANHFEEISDVIAAWKIPEGTEIGAVISASLQNSRGNYNPRFLIPLPKGGIATLLLEGDSIEYAFTNKRATIPLPVLLPRAKDRISHETGEILVDMKPFPRRNQVFNLTNSVNRWNTERRTRDTKSCTHCHVDTETTKAAYGQLPIQLGEEKILALVSPSNESEVAANVLCVPRDLEALYKCQCHFERFSLPLKEECSKFSDGKLSREGCKRLKAILRFQPKQNPEYGSLPERPCL